LILSKLQKKYGCVFLITFFDYIINITMLQSTASFPKLPHKLKTISFQFLQLQKDWEIIR